jgi:allantoicase
MRKIVSHSRMYLERERERKEDYDDEDGWMDGWEAKFFEESQEAESNISQKGTTEISLVEIKRLHFSSVTC